MDTVYVLKINDIDGFRFHGLNKIGGIDDCRGGWRPF